MNYRIAGRRERERIVNHGPNNPAGVRGESGSQRERERKRERERERGNGNT